MSKPKVLKTITAKRVTGFENYSPAEILALAFEVQEQQGFIRSGEGYTRYDEDLNPVVVKDNKTCIVEMVSAGIKPNAEYVARAEAEIERVSGKLMLKKMSGDMTGFEDILAKSFSDDIELTPFHASIIASVPNGIAVDAKRERVRERMESLIGVSEHFGQVRNRYDVDVEVVDVKYIQNGNVYMITTVYNDKDVIKFWWRDQPDISDIIEGKRIRIRGTVNKYEQNKYMHNIKETMLNRVKILSV